jgi:hypothetical protein
MLQQLFDSNCPESDTDRARIAYGLSLALALTLAKHLAIRIQLSFLECV